jgi:hypothetical protein
MRNDLCARVRYGGTYLIDGFWMHGREPGYSVSYEPRNICDIPFT